MNGIELLHTLLDDKKDIRWEKNPPPSINTTYETLSNEKIFFSKIKNILEMFNISFVDNNGIDIHESIINNDTILLPLLKKVLSKFEGVCKIFDKDGKICPNQGIIELVFVSAAIMELFNVKASDIFDKDRKYTPMNRVHVCLVSSA